MSLEEPLLNSVETQPKAPERSLTRSSSKVKKSSQQAPPPATLFEQLLQARESEPMWDYFKKEKQNIKEIEVLDLLISRLSHHTAAMGDAQIEYKVIARLRDVGVELQEFSKRLEDVPVLKMFLDDLEAVKGFGPLPTILNMKNFLYGVDMAFDRDVKLSNLDDDDELDAVNPEGARGGGDCEDDDENGDDDSAKAGSDGSGNSDEGSNENNEDDDDDDEHKVKAADLMAKYTAKQMRNELRQLGGDHTTKASPEELAKKLAEALNARQMQTLGDFSDRWWDWKGKKVLQDAQVEVVQKFCDDVSMCVTSRLLCALSDFDKFPICDWFSSVLMSSLQEQSFGMLNFAFEIDDNQYSNSLPKDMSWTQLGVHVQAAIRLRLLEEVAASDCCRDFSLAIADIHCRVLPAFILKLTRLKAIMASQVVTTDQMRNKILAGAVTAAMAVMSVGLHVAAKYAGVQSDG